MQMAQGSLQKLCLGQMRFSRMADFESLPLRNNPELLSRISLFIVDGAWLDVFHWRDSNER